MLKAIVVATALLGASACSDKTEPQPLNTENGGGSGGAPVTMPTGIDSVRFTATHGECMGFCQESLLVGRDGAAVRFATNGTEPVIEQAVEVEPTVRAQILTAGRETLAETWDARYGCPDCGDQGAYEIEITANGVTRKTILDPLQHPAWFDSLLAALEPVRTAHPAPTTVCAAAPQACTLGQISVVLTLGADGALKPTWYNDTNQTIYLAGCTTVTFQREGDESVVSAAVCAWEGTARVVAPRSAFSDISLQTKGKPGTYSATGSYSLGCTPGEPLSKAGCTSSTPVTSNKVSTN